MNSRIKLLLLLVFLCLAGQSIISIISADEPALPALIKEIPNLTIVGDGKATLNLSEFFLGAEYYSCDAKNLSAEFKESTATFTPREGFVSGTSALITAYSGNASALSNPFYITSQKPATIHTSRDRVVLGKEARWVKTVIPGDSNTTIKLAGVVANVTLCDRNGDCTVRFSGGRKKLGLQAFEEREIVLDNASTYTVEYYTVAPSSNETLTSDGKIITVSAPDEMNYTDVIAYTELNATLAVADKDKIRVYWQASEDAPIKNVADVPENAQIGYGRQRYRELPVPVRREMPFEVYDTNNDTFIDRIEWVVPHLSSQTFEIIIIKPTIAAHLDSLRNYISDVYNEISALDNEYALISSGDYLRVTFEKSLNRNNDITIFARSSGTASYMEVYEENSSVLLAQFPILGVSGAYYSTKLSEMSSSDDYSQATFDLKAYGDVEVDYVIDPYTDNGSLSQNVNDCGTLSTANALYTLTQNVTANGTCFNLTANNITLDGSGFTVNYSANGSVGYGIFTAKKDCTIKNLNIREGSTANSGKIGIFLYSSDSNGTVVRNNTVITLTQSSGIIIQSGNNSIINNSASVSNAWSNSYPIQASSAAASNLYIFGNILNHTNTGSGNGHGLYLSAGGGGKKILNNIIYTYSSGYGIYALTNGLSNATVGNNTVVAASATFGIYIDSCTNLTLSGNIVNTTAGQGYGVTGSSLAQFNLSMDTTNLAEGLPVYYSFNINNQNWLANADYSSVYGQLICGGCNNITVQNVTMSTDGLLLAGTNNSLVNGSVISATGGNALVIGGYFNRINNNTLTTSSSNQIPLYPLTSWNNITNNYISANADAYAVYLSGIGYIQLINNSIRTASGTSYCLYLSSAQNNTINGNNVIGSGYALHMDASPYNNLSNNNFTSGGAACVVYVRRGSNNNYFEGNAITSTSISSATRGILFGTGTDSGATSLVFNRTTVTLTGSPSQCGVYVGNTGSTDTFSFVDSIISTSGCDFGVGAGITDGSWNFTNTSNATGSRLGINWTDGSAGTLYQRWYVDVNVTLDRNPVSGANVSIYRSDGTLETNSTTDATGAARYILIDYIQNGSNATTNRTYYSNYTFNANSTTGNATKQVNVSTNLVGQSQVRLYMANYLYSCGSLSLANTYYALGSNVTSNSTCFNVTANNVTFDGNGYSVNYSANGTVGYGIYVSGNNYTTVKNGVFREGIASGGNKYAVYLANSNNNNITNNSITGIGSSSEGAIFVSLASSGNIVSFNNISVASGYGIDFSQSNNCQAFNNTITSSGTSAGGLFISSSGNRVSNNTVILTGQDSKGIQFQSNMGTAENNTFSGNRLNVSGEAIQFAYSSSASHFNESVDTTNLAEGLPIMFNYSISNQAISGINNNYGAVICAWCTNVTYLGANMTNSDGISIVNSTRVTITNANLSSTNGYGVYIYSGGGNNTVSNSAIASSAGIDLYGIYVYFSNMNNITGNTISSAGTGSYAVYFSSSSAGQVRNNIINATGSSSAGIYLTSNSNNNTIAANNISASNTSGAGIYIQTCSGNAISSGAITTFGTSGNGVTMQSLVDNTTFSGMSIRTNGSSANAIYMYNSNNNFTITDSILNSSSAGTFELYANSLVTGGTWNMTNVSRSSGAQINVSWQPLANGTLNYGWWMDANVKNSLGSGAAGINVSAYNSTGTLYASNSTDSSGNARLGLWQYTQVNGTANTTYGRYQVVARNTTTGDAGIAYLNMTADVSLNFNLDNLTTCGILNTSGRAYAMTQNLTINGTCFNITASNITLNGAGFTVNYSADSTLGYGVYVSGYNSTRLNDIMLKEGSATTAAKHAVYLYNANYSAVNGTTIATIGAGSHGIYFRNSSFSNATLNAMRQASSSSYCIYLDSSNNFTASFNSINASGGSGIYALSSSYGAVSSNILNSTGAGFGIYSSAMQYSLVSNNTIRSDMYGLQLMGNSLYNRMLGNAIFAYSSGAYCVGYAAASGTNFTSDTLVAYGALSYGINSSGNSTNVAFRNMNISMRSTGYAFIVSDGSKNFSILDSYLNSSPSSAEVFVSQDSSGGEFNLTNVTHPDRTAINATFAAGAGGTLKYHDYFKSSYTNTLGALVSGVTVTGISNLTGQTAFTNTTNSSGEIGYVPLLQFTENQTGTYNYSLYNIQITSPPLYHLRDNVTINLTTSKSFLVQKPLADVVLSTANKAITDYGRVLYSYLHNITIAAYNSSITITNITVSNADPTNPVNGSSIYSNCANITAELNCTATLNITLNANLGLSSTTNTFRINYTTYNGTNVSATTTSTMQIQSYIQLASNVSSFNISQNVSETKDIIVNLTSVGNGETGTITISQGHSFFSYAQYIGDSWDTLSSTISSLPNQESALLRIRFSISNYTQAQYNGSINFSYSSKVLSILYSINVSPSVLLNFSNTTQQHNTTVQYRINATNIGSVRLVNLSMNYSESTLPSGWVTLDQSSFNCEVGELCYRYINVSIPYLTSPGIYAGSINISDAYGYSASLPVAIQVPYNRTWTVEPTQINSSISIDPNPLDPANRREIANLTVSNYGNVPLNLSISGLTDLSGMGYTAFSTSKFSSAENNASILVAKGTNLTMPFYVLSSESSAANLGLGIIFNLTNSTSSSNATLMPIIKIDIIDSPPLIGNWTVNSTDTVNDTEIEVNSTYKVMAYIYDDSNSKNSSTAFFNLTYPDNGGTSAIVQANVSGSYYYTYIHPNVTGQITIRLNITEASGQFQTGNGTLTLKIVGKPQSVAISNIIPPSTAQVNKTGGATVPINFTFTEIGNVSIYSLNITALPAPETNVSWPSDSVNYSTYTARNLGMNYTLNVSIAAGAQNQAYTYRITANWTNPDLTTNSTYRNVSITVLPNYNFTLSAVQNVSIPHGTSANVTLNITPLGNEPTNISLSYNSTRYSSCFISNGCFSQLTGATAVQLPDTIDMTAKQISIAVPENSSLNDTLVITGQNSQGARYIINVSVTVPENRTITASTNNITRNLVAGRTFTNLNVLELSSIGNLNTTANITIAGNVTSLTGFAYPHNITLTPGTRQTITLNFTVPGYASNRYNGTMSIVTSGSETFTIPINLSSYEFALNTYQTSDLALRHAEDIIAMNISLEKMGTGVNTGIMFASSVGNSTCSPLQNNSLEISGGKYTAVNCTLPLLPDGYSYSIIIYANYTDPDLGLIELESSAVTVSYLDITPPSVVSAAFTSLASGIAQSITVNISDNVEVTDTYHVNATLTSTLTGAASQIDTFTATSNASSYRAVGITVEKPGTYTFAVTVTDASGNVNSSYSDTLVFYNIRNFTGNFTFLNDSSLSAPANLSILLNGSRTYQANMTGVLNMTDIYTGIYNMTISGYNSNLTFYDVDLLDQPSTLIMDYGQFQTQIYRSLVTALVPEVKENRIFNGFYVEMNTSSNMRLSYYYGNYSYFLASDLKVYMCRDYDLATYDCGSGWMQMTQESKNNSVVTFRSPIRSQAKTTHAFLFYEHPSSDNPTISFDVSRLNLTADHNTTSNLSLVLRAGTGGDISNPAFSCDTSASPSFCSAINVTVPSLPTAITRGQSVPCEVTVSIPAGTTPGTYTGSLIFRSNQATSRPVTGGLDIQVTVLSSANLSATANNSTVTISGGGNNILLDTVVLRNSGNANRQVIVTTNATLVSESNITLAKGNQTSYGLNISTPKHSGLYAYYVNFSERRFTYRVNVSRWLNISGASPSANLRAGDNITVSYDVFDENNNVIESSELYFSNASISVDSQACQGTNLWDYSSPGHDIVNCSLPSQAVTEGQKNLTLSLYIYPVFVRDTINLSYRDITAPRVVGTPRQPYFGYKSNISLELYDVSGINMSNVSVAVTLNSSPVASYASPGYSGTFYNTSNTTVLLSYNFTQTGEYNVTFTYSDIYGNTAQLSKILSVYPTIAFNSSQNPLGRGKYASIISSVIRNTSGSPVSAQAFFRLPLTNDSIYEANNSEATGLLSIDTIQNRTYDIVVRAADMNITMRSIGFNGTSILSFEKVINFSSSKYLAGYSFNSGYPINATLTMFANKSADITKYKTEVCHGESWDYASGVCLGTMDTVTPDSSGEYNSSHFYFAYNVSSFSTYVISVPETVQTDQANNTGNTTIITTVSSSSGGGGGGGASIKEISSLLNQSLENITKNLPSVKDLQTDTKSIEKTLEPGETKYVTMSFANTINDTQRIRLKIDETLSGVISVRPVVFFIPKGETREVLVEMTAPKEVRQDSYDGFIRAYNLKEYMFLSIPISIKVQGKEEVPSLSLNLFGQQLPTDGILRGQYGLDYSYTPSQADFTFELVVSNLKKDAIYDSRRINKLVTESFKENFDMPLSHKYPVGQYLVNMKATFKDSDGNDRTLVAVSSFEVTQNFLLAKVFSIGDFDVQIRHIIMLLLLLMNIPFAAKLYGLKREAKRKYHLPIDINKLPEPSVHNGYIGKIAESNSSTYIDFEALKMHTLIAGSTGGGKTFSAQVIAEEALKHNISVVVFDPTAQWTGFLRKNNSQSLLKSYPLFNMNSDKDPTAFKGNIRRVENPLEIIELKEYLRPGEISVFDLHKMTFEEIDLFVANTISQVFLSELDESPHLRLLMVYDEVHRLLPKFGGSGAGFMQVERGCREFRKWGIGMLLISQVLSDFIGQVRANINTEIQMKTRDEEDLKRLSLKYGEELLRSVVKADVGTGMIQNSAYNLGRPYLVTFRPLLHAIERLPEKELQEYYEYNVKLLDLYDSLDQLERLKVDVIDMRIEVDLALEKLKEAKFDIVEIYIDGVVSNVEKKWAKLGRQPERRKIKLLDRKTVDRFIELAKKQHYEAPVVESNIAGIEQDVKGDSPDAEAALASVKKSEKMQHQIVKEKDIKNLSRARHEGARGYDLLTPASSSTEVRTGMQSDVSSGSQLGKGNNTGANAGTGGASAQTKLKSELERMKSVLGDE